ncbi:pyridoxine 5'-phosphate synthase [Muricoccus radiodurans]|uniref:pyridoxine 5'-phosphate synthase n=1 Tax=Muricoccus radiodurans TaxID=2231721 RepID=UPI003CE94EE3
MRPLRLGVNVDHVATLRNARGGTHPDPLAAARAALAAGADSITIHLREDRRHIRDADCQAMRAALTAPINLEMAATAEMEAIATALRPHACCLVPERRAELTTEGGLDAAGHAESLAPVIAALGAAGIRVSLFLDPDLRQVEAAARLGARAVELHTGTFCEAGGDARRRELDRLAEAARRVDALGMECHAGHGLDYDTAPLLAAIPEVVELNIGHFLIGQALFDGLPAAVRRMRAVMDGVRRP